MAEPNVKGTISAEIHWTPLGARGVGIKEIKKIATEGLVDTYQVIYSDGATYTYQVKNGKDGEAFKYEDFTPEQLEALTGPRGPAFTYEDFTPEQLAELVGPPGRDGIDGRDGYDPTVEIEKIEGGHKITITDRNGPNTAELHDGKDGKDGQDGYAPIVEIVKIEGGHKITITDRNGPQTAELRNGKDFTYEDFTPEQLEDLTGPRGPAGYSGVYVGSGTPPETANVWIDPEGEATRSETWVMTTEEGIEVDKHVVLIM